MIEMSTRLIISYSLSVWDVIRLRESRDFSHGRTSIFCKGGESRLATRIPSSAPIRCRPNTDTALILGRIGCLGRGRGAFLLQLQLIMQGYALLNRHTAMCQDHFHS